MRPTAIQSADTQQPNMIAVRPAHGLLELPESHLKLELALAPISVLCSSRVGHQVAAERQEWTIVPVVLVKKKKTKFKIV